MGDFMAICEEERNRVRTSSSRVLSSGSVGFASASGLESVEADNIDDLAEIWVAPRRLEFSPSMSCRALRSASCSNRASFSSSSVSARFMRSVATILLASSNKAWDRDSSSASKAAFSSATVLRAARSLSSADVSSSISLEAIVGKAGMEDEARWWAPVTAEASPLDPDGVVGRVAGRGEEVDPVNRNLKNRLSCCEEDGAGAVAGGAGVGVGGMTGELTDELELLLVPREESKLVDRSSDIRLLLMLASRPLALRHPTS